jgi:hypothetical protein
MAQLEGFALLPAGLSHGEIRRGLLEIAGRAQISSPVALTEEKETSITFSLSRSLDC